MIEHVVRAVQRKWHIFPVETMGKTPRCGGPWSKAATNDVNQVVRWWTVSPRANIGIACKPSELLVIDCDRAKSAMNLAGTKWEHLHEGYGPLVHGEDLLDEIRHTCEGQIPPTYTVRTGSGGLHIYLWWPSSWPRASQSSIWKGLIDVRSNGGEHGGYVLGGGSVTESGKYVIVDDSPVAIAPSWIRSMCVEPPPPPRMASALIRQPGSVSFSGLAESVATATPGNRNNALLWAARAMCSDGATEEEAEEILGEAARMAGLDDHEIGMTIRSAYRIQRRKDGT